MTNRFNKENHLHLLEDLAPSSRVAVAAAALERMSVGYAIWAQEKRCSPVESILDDVWAYASLEGSLPDAKFIESLYPDPGAPATLESPYAESFVEALQLLGLFASTQETMRLVEVLQAAYNMSDNAAGDVLVRYNDPQFDHRLTSDMDRLMSTHPWVDRELAAQRMDIAEAQLSSDLRSLIGHLRTRARAHPVVSASELDEIRTFQAG
ncbi:hypothetical protein [Luteibacter sahnii]|uniref:hypothetical protein n=1 Tax=Luteibacter sahnii TaxID=3021977 RepID=UPI002A6A7348|nr:hypothetical protein [Luteibacter sp. PPL193]MDY1547661.1 hypothetical protein [Luteibacter sp. PPL193]